MDEDQRKVYVAAIKTRAASTYDDVDSQIACEAGLDLTGVRIIIAFFVKEHILHRCATKAIDRFETPNKPVEHVKAWYEAGTVTP